MPVDTTIISDVSPDETIEAEDLRDRFKELQRFVNGGIEDSDFKRIAGSSTREGVVETQHIYKPEFYGSPSPTVVGVSSDTVYRRRSGNKLDRYYRHEAIGGQILESFTVEAADDDSTAWQPIEGLSTTVYVHESTSPQCLIMGNFYAFESGGKNGYSRSKITNGDKWGRFEQGRNRLESESGYYRSMACGTGIAVFMLFVDTMNGDGPQPIKATRRTLYGTGGGRYRLRRMNHSFTHKVALTQGENKISYRCFYRQKAHDDKRLRHLYIDARNLVVDILYR